MSSPSDFFERVAIIGTGLIGGSWGLALNRAGFGGVRVGCDRRIVLESALSAGAIDQAEENPIRALKGANLVILAAPVRVILRLLDELKGIVDPAALITDVGSTKEIICRKAQENFGGEPLFMGGHPLAGKENSGIENASPVIFDDATYILTPSTQDTMADPRVTAFVHLITTLGSRPIQMDAAEHDHAMAWLSHLPQLASTALASLIEEQPGLPVGLAASGFRDSTRLAGSPYGIWRDICSSNQENIQKALDSLIVKLKFLRDQLTDKTLEREFKQAHELREKLQERM